MLSGAMARPSTSMPLFNGALLAATRQGDDRAGAVNIEDYFGGDENYMGMGQNHGTLVNIKIDGIYGCE